MKVLLINGLLYSTDGRTVHRRASVADTMIVHLARGFVQLGCSVTLVACSAYAPTADEDLGFEVVYLPAALTGVFRTTALPWMPALHGWLKRHAAEYDMVVSSEIFSLATLTASRVCSERMLVWHELALKPRALWGIPSALWYGVVAPLMLRRCRIVARSEAARQFVLEQGFTRVARDTVDHGVDGAVFAPGDHTDPLLLVVAQLVPRKRVGHIINAFAQLIGRPGRQQFTLTIAGQGQQREALEAQVKALGVERSVTFAGQLSHADLAPLMRRATALLVATEQDNSMVTIAEALACGTPVLTTSVPTNAAVIAKRGLGIVDDHWNADTLEKLIDHHAELRRACLQASPEFTATHTAQALLDNAPQFTMHNSQLMMQ